MTVLEEEGWNCANEEEMHCAGSRVRVAKSLMLVGNTMENALKEIGLEGQEGFEKVHGIEEGIRNRAWKFLKESTEMYKYQVRKGLYFA